MATSSSKQIINPTQPPNHSFIFRPLSNPTPNPNPRPRGRRSGSGSSSGNNNNNNNNNNTKSKNDTKDKPRRRGVGMAELERLRRLNDQSSSSPPPHHPHTVSRVDPPLPGVPLIHYCIPGQPVSDPTLSLRISGMPTESSYNELPSIPNSFHLDHSPLFSFKKKRVIGEEVVGFSKGYNGNFSGYDLNNYNGDNNNNHYLAVNEGFSANTVATTGSEIVAIHKKLGGSMMEYGFFPKKSEKSDSSPSSSSSTLSSLTTATTTTTTSSIDLSLKLSSYY